MFLLVDALDDFSHERGRQLFSSFTQRHDQMASLLSEGRAAEVPVVFANDNKGAWDADVNGLVQRALSGPGGPLLGDLLPRPGERFIVKPRYSAARELDFMVTVAARACASTDPTLERTALRYLVEVVGVGLDDTLDSWDAGSG